MKNGHDRNQNDNDDDSSNNDESNSNYGATIRMENLDIFRSKIRTHNTLSKQDCKRDDIAYSMPSRYSCRHKAPKKYIEDSLGRVEKHQTSEGEEFANGAAVRRLSMSSQGSASTISSSKSFASATSCYSSTPSLHLANPLQDDESAVMDMNDSRSFDGSFTDVFWVDSNTQYVDQNNNENASCSQHHNKTGITMRTIAFWKNRLDFLRRHNISTNNAPE